ncbi:DUF6338 family protein [Streptomyces griseoincarnatus]|uniref:DUF6338 family protein n=1 Tax=unclassified Streptomyces TaxID=2593676 RepID=UPI002697E02F|nr:DUF6338 family protein [Streptomyces sp. I5]
MSVQPPSTVEQVLLLIVLVLPGVTYQYLRERRRGPVAGEQVFADRVLRAMTASVALDAVYAVVLGPYAVEAVRRSGSGFQAVGDHPRAAGLWALVLFLGVPGAAAVLVSWWERRGARSVYRPTPTAWDHVFRGLTRPSFVRARLKDGAWVGGWFDARSYASGYPHGGDLFLQWSYQMNQDGSFGPPVAGTGGVYLRVENIDVLELVDATPADNGRTPHA